MTRKKTPFEEPFMKEIKKKGKVEVGKTYYGLPRGFQSLVRCEVLKIYEKSAMVKIISCNSPADDVKQVALGDVTVVSLRNLKLAV